MLTGVFTALQLVHYVLLPKLPTLVQVFTLAFTLGVFIRGILIMKKPEKRKSVRWDSALFAALILVLIAGNCGAIMLTVPLNGTPLRSLNKSK